MAQVPIPVPPPVNDPIDFRNVQGDILRGGFPKKAQVFWFFVIDGNQVPKFRVNLKKILPFITNSEDTQKKRDEIRYCREMKRPGMVPTSLTNIAFSAHGLNKICGSLQINPSVGDAIFDKGMRDEAELEGLGDRFPEWNRGFQENNIDGVILIAGDDAARNASELGIIIHILEADRSFGPVHEAFRLTGHTRPGSESGHEHFGFLDGVSQPAVPGVDKPGPFQTVYDGVGRLLMKHNHDDQLNPQTKQTETVPRPDWTRDGSIMCFRKLDQLVPEFHAFLNAFPVHIDDPSAPPNLGSELLGARMVGRWLSGAPVQMTPLNDDPNLAGRNDFDFADDASRCPFSAHIRKTNPRHDTIPNTGGKTFAVPTHSIMRRGIQFGDEVTQHERSSNRSDPSHPRGLLFVCYQSNLSNGFSFMQKNWANKPGFKPIPSGAQVGFDPIIGQNITGPTEASVNTGEPSNPGLTLARWVISRGGEYFFTPSIWTLANMFGLDFA